LGIERKSSDLDQSGHALFGAHQEIAPLSRPEAARSAVFAAMDGWVEAGLATWNERVCEYDQTARPGWYLSSGRVEGAP
jgi:hypothetical protein